MATFDIEVSAQSNKGGTQSGEDTFSTPGDFDGATIDSVLVVGSPTITSDGTTDDTVGVRFVVRDGAITNIYGAASSDTAALCFAVLGEFVSSDTIVEGSAVNPAPTIAVAADWVELTYRLNYTANMKADAETCSWSAFTIRVTYTPTSNDVTLTADPGSLVLSGAVAALGLILLAGPASLVLSGAEATLVLSDNVVLTGDPGSLVLSGAEADLVASNNVALTGDPGSLVLSGAEATLVLSDNFVLTGDPGSLVLSGAVADLIDSDAPPAIFRRGGRFLFDREIEESEHLEELIQLVEPEIAPKSVSTDSPQGLESIMGISGGVYIPGSKRVLIRIPASKKVRVDRLLAHTGLTLEELLVIIG